ncbi:hypothetical protein WEN_03320 [Mycoplasma wenyonii str. Massachusetts]|uniref:Uncharacterized protein n=1 Tax=Mycoplasma wenyonii (strain Massachusetts) TaxID=1197325 RepID=I6YBQ0_MYCWM|nr:hypothetical protein [Mycoplasma wenyonii]AFN65441.1 hypothetical protein WEN_03320 [Mycoplasma wenyonii str. Massachusetts]
MFWIPFLQEITGRMAAEKTGYLISGVGVFALSAIIYWQYKKISETKNTVGMSKGFLFGQLLACLFIVIASAFRISHVNDSPADGVSVNASLISIGFFLFFVNLYTLKMKLSHSLLAKKAGVSEAQYYENVILPTLDVDSLVNQITLQ